MGVVYHEYTLASIDKKSKLCYSIWLKKEDT